MNCTTVGNALDYAPISLQIWSIKHTRLFCKMGNMIWVIGLWGNIYVLPVLSKWTQFQTYTTSQNHKFTMPSKIIYMNFLNL